MLTRSPVPPGHFGLAGDMRPSGWAKSCSARFSSICRSRPLSEFAFAPSRQMRPKGSGEWRGRSRSCVITSGGLPISRFDRSRRLIWEGAFPNADPGMNNRESRRSHETAPICGDAGGSHKSDHRPCESGGNCVPFPSHLRQLFQSHNGLIQTIVHW
jgi:hypothetical protein